MFKDQFFFALVYGIIIHIFVEAMLPQNGKTEKVLWLKKHSLYQKTYLINYVYFRNL